MDIFESDNNDRPVKLDFSFNHNVLVVGGSGSGKSFLSRYFTTQTDFIPKMSIVYRHSDLGKQKKGYSLKDLRPGLMEKTKNNFIDSFVLSSQISNTGIMASYIPFILSHLSGSSIPDLLKSASVFKAENSILDGSVLFVKSMLDHFYPVRYDKKSKKMKLIEILPIDRFSFSDRDYWFLFDNLDYSESLFFSEYLLRVAFEQKLGNLYIDEFHRLAKFPNSIVGRLLREYRTIGSLWCVSQSLSDIDPGLLNNFGTILVFNSISPLDLEILRKIDDRLPLRVSSLLPYEFINLRDYLGRKVVNNPYILR